MGYMNGRRMLSFGLLCLLLGVGYAVRRKMTVLQRLYLPASVIAGLIGLMVFQAVPLPAAVAESWKGLPGLLINVVFACLFLGVEIPAFSRVWRSASRQLAYGQIVAWGQYVVGCALTLLLLKPLFGQPDIFAGIMPVGFEGGAWYGCWLGACFRQTRVSGDERLCVGERDRRDSFRHRGGYGARELGGA